MKRLFQILIIILFTCIYAQSQRINYALQFDGKDDYAHTPIQCFPKITNNFTIELWVKPEGLREPTPESNSGVSGTSKQRYAIYPEYGTAYGEDHSGAGISVGTNGISIFEHASFHMPSLLVYNNYLYDWNHIAIVFKNKQPILYVNGSKVKTGVKSTKTIHPSAYLAEVNANYGFYKGSIDEVRIWSTCRNEKEIKSNMHNILKGDEPGLEGYWRLDEGSGTSAMDLSKNKNHLTLINNPTWIQSDIPINKGTLSTENNKMKVAVVEFNQKGNLTIKDAGVIVAEWLSSSLHKTNTYELYERVLLQKILEEHQLAMTGLIDEKTTAKIGKMYGVNLIVTGTISKFGEIISLVVKLIDTETAKILATSDLKTKNLEDIPKQMDQIAQNLINWREDE